jgi:CMP-N-acetylneuraminic acid synthetase
MVVQYAIEYSLSLGANVHTVVSTDIKELITYCKDTNIDYINRNPKFCLDNSRIDDALAESIELRGKNCQLCSLVYGNIPTRHPPLFHKAIQFLKKNEDFDGVISMQNVEKFHPDWMFDYDDEILPREKTCNYRRQMLPQKMIPDGHTFVFRAKNFADRYSGMVSYDTTFKYSIFGDKIKPLINDRVIIDIDTKKDLKIAESVLSYNK